MTAYDFSFVKNTSITFDATVDTLNLGAIDASSLTVAAGTDSVTITTAAGEFVTLQGATIEQLSLGNVFLGVATNRSVLWVGDNNVLTAVDGIANTIDLTVNGTNYVAANQQHSNHAVYGLDGNDSITSGNGNNLIFGGAGADRIIVGTGNNTIYGGSNLADTADGNDNISILTVGGSNTIYANGGNDLITLGGIGGAGSNAGTTQKFWLGVGNDTLQANVAGGGQLSAGNYEVYAGRGNDSVLLDTTGDVTITGGNGVSDTLDGDDIITLGGTGNVLVYANSGNDSVTVGATLAGKSATVYAGLGNDTITAGGAANSNTVLYGNSGNDTITTTSAGNVTIYGGNGAADSTDGNDVITVSNTSGKVTVYANAGNDTITANALAATSEVTVYTGVGADVVNVAGGHATSKFNLHLADGADVVNFNATTAGQLITINGFDAAADKVNVTLNGGAAAQAATLELHNGFLFEDTFGGGAGEYQAGNEAAINFVGLAGDFNGTNLVIGNNSSKVLTNLFGAAAATLTGGTGNDLLVAGGLGDTLVSGGGADKLIGGAGNDTFRLAGNTLTGTIQGGEGTDTVEFGTGAANIGDADFTTNFSSIEALKFAAGANHAVTLETRAQAVGVNNINASALTAANGLTVTASAATYTNALTVVGGAGADTVIRGAQVAVDNISLGDGADIISYANAGLTAADTLDGGAGVDVLQISDAASLTDAVFANKTNIETLTLQHLAADAQTVTLGTAAEATGIVTVNASVATASVTIDASAYATKALTITGGTVADTIIGGAGADIIRGGQGADTINLTAGGIDRVVFEANGTNNGVDVITGFTAGASGDVFDFHTVQTTFGGTVTESLFSGEIATAATNLATTAANTGVFVFTNNAVGNAAALRALLDGNAFDDTTTLGNRVAVWEISATEVGVAIINNDDDGSAGGNGDVTVTQVASLTFADQAAVDAFTTGLVIGNFDLIA